MEYLLNDYSCFGDESILKEVSNLALEVNDPYFEGKYTKLVQEKLTLILGMQPNLFFLTGGTQTNALVIASQLKRFEAVISAESGHINLHEAGAVENLGHKIIQIKSNEGKITAENIQTSFDINNDSHMVCPKMVYISQPTELGTLYTKSELISIKRTCENNGLKLFIDGARLAIALAKDKKITLKDYYNLSDIFYFGGTKIGLPLGEMLIIKDKKNAKDFEYYMKQFGALLAKGEFISALFYKLLENEKYLILAENSLNKSQKLVEFLKSKNIKFKYTPQTNQLFPILNNKTIDKLSKYIKFSIWENFDKKSSVIRLVTSFDTTDDIVANFIEDFNKCH